MSSKVLIRSLGFPVRRAEVPLLVHRANPDSDGEVDLPTFRLISKSISCGYIGREAYTPPVDTDSRVPANYIGKKNGATTVHILKSTCVWQRSECHLLRIENQSATPPISLRSNHVLAVPLYIPYALGFVVGEERTTCHMHPLMEISSSNSCSRRMHSVQTTLHRKP